VAADARAARCAGARMTAFITELHFLRPAALLLVLLVPVIVWLARRVQLARDPWRAAVDAHLLHALRVPESASRGHGPLPLAILAYLIALLALAGPAWQRLPQPLLRADAALIIALDLSDSMRAADLAPNRLARARFKIADVLTARPDGQVALIAYSGDAFVVAPLTDDANTVRSLLAALDHDTLPEPGQRADRAIRLASKLLASAGFAEGDLLLLTDRALPRDREAAIKAAASGLRISVLGVGTAAGAPVALPGGGFMRDAAGAMQLPKLDANALQALAAAAGGVYHPLSSDDSDLRALALGVPRAAALNSDEQATSDHYQDGGVWLLLVLLPLAALLFRRGWLACVPLAVLLTVPPPAAALDWSSLWRRDDQRAWDALQANELETARALAKDPLLSGSAAYRSDDFAAAAEAFGAADTPTAHYNRGNALARSGKLQEALQAYDAALAREPGMDDAVANRAAVEAALKQQQQQQQQGDQGDSQEGDDSQESSTDKNSPEDANGDPSGSQDQSGESQQAPTGGEPGKPSDDQGSEDGSAAEPAPPTDAEAQAQAQQQAEQFAEEMAKALADDVSKDEASEGEPQGDEAKALSPAEIEANEQRQALEQLLRRVPDDPGGLLRRKFAIEAQRRQRDGNENDR